MQLEQKVRFKVRLSAEEMASLWRSPRIWPFGSRSPSLFGRPASPGIASISCKDGRMTLVVERTDGKRHISIRRNSGIYKKLVKFVLKKIQNPEFVRQNLAKSLQTNKYSAELIDKITAQLERVGTQRLVAQGVRAKWGRGGYRVNPPSAKVRGYNAASDHGSSAGQDKISSTGAMDKESNRMGTSTAHNGTALIPGIAGNADSAPVSQLPAITSSASSGSQPATRIIHPASAGQSNNIGNQSGLTEPPCSQSDNESAEAKALQIEDLPIFEIEFEDDTEPSREHEAEKEQLFHESFRFIGSPVVESETAEAAQAGPNGPAPDGIKVRIEFACAPILVPELSLYVHWGECKNTAVTPADAWTDEEITTKEICQLSPGLYAVTKLIHPFATGTFGATFYAQFKHSDTQIWCGGPGERDLRFDYLRESEQALSREQHLAALETLRKQASVTRGLASFDRFVATVSRLTREQKIHGMGKVLFDITKDDPYLRRLVSSYYGKALELLQEEKISAGNHPTNGKSLNGRAPAQNSRRAKLEATLRLLQTLGVGDIAIVSPEGPQAIAGGLAQVVVGLSNSLANWGVSTTIISPLYEESQGNKHKSAEQLLQDGIRLRGATVPIRELGEIRIRFGPTQYSGTDKVKRFAKFVTVSVYEASNHGVRCIFLRHRDLADRLYPKLTSDEELRRAVFLSRGALEVIKDKRFDVSPHILISNDWITGLVPAYLQCERRYSEDDRLNTIETIHTIHNCGRAYQGRIYVNQFGEDLWPLLGFKNEHFFGVADPHDKNFLNLTGAAVRHVKKAILTVSKPYSEQLLSHEGGDGLEGIFRARADCVFGISNGIDAGALRNIYWKFGEHARSALNRAPLVGGRFQEDPFFSSLPEYKGATKHLIQQIYGLNDNPDAVLISLVGRLAEQKGISLLTDRAGSEDSLLEQVLKRYPNVQLLIGGPPAPNDPYVAKLREEIDRLTVKYSGRIAAIFEFISHEEALKITQASELFLMPSRYEPGGITQLEALAAGTLVIARNVGGIRATISNYEERLGRGNGFLFTEYSGGALRGAIARALEVTRDLKRLHALGVTAAKAQHDWSERVPKYLALFQHVSGVVNSRHSFFQCLDPQLETLESIRPERAVLARWLKAPFCPVAW